MSERALIRYQNDDGIVTLNFATAKAAEANCQQGKSGNMYAEIGGFIKGEFKPGLEHKE